MTSPIKAAAFTLLFAPAMAFANDGPINVDSFFDFEKTLVVSDSVVSHDIAASGAAGDGPSNVDTFFDVEISAPTLSQGIAGVNAQLEQSPAAAEAAATYNVSLYSSGDL